MDIKPVAPFRTARTPVVPPKGAVETDAPAPVNTMAETPETSTQPSLAIWSEVNGHPYTAEYFGLTSLLQAEGGEDTKQDIYEVDGYILQYIQDNALQSTPEAYAEVLEGINNQIGTYQNEESVAYFRRVATAIKAMNRMKLARVKPVLDMSQLTPSEYTVIHGGRSV